MVTGTTRLRFFTYLLDARRGQKLHFSSLLGIADFTPKAAGRAKSGGYGGPDWTNGFYVENWGGTGLGGWGEERR